MATDTSTAEDKKPARRVAAKAVDTATQKKAPAKKSAGKTATAKTATAKTIKADAIKKAPAKSAKTAGKSSTAKSSGKKSRDTSKSAKERVDHVDRVWELAERIGVAMFVTWDGQEQRARPLAAHIEKDEGAIYFLTDVKGAKDDQVAEFPHVSVNFADHKRSKYVAISGVATVLNDREKIKDLWSPFAKAWWDSPEDPAIRVIKLVPRDAEFWDSPGRIVTSISMLAAAVTGRTPKIGENAKVVL